MSNIKKDLRAAERELQEMGFSLLREGNHRIWRDARGRTVVVPKPHRSGDPRAIKNLDAIIQRMKKEQ